MYQSYPLTVAKKAERFDYFSSLVDELFSPSQCDLVNSNVSEFNGELEATDLGQVKIAKVGTSALTVNRTKSHISHLTDAPYLVKFQLQGESFFTQRNNEIHLTPGDFVICTTAEPYKLQFTTDYQMSVLAVAETSMNRLMRNPDNLLGKCMPADDPCCGLLSSFVSSVVEKMADLPAPMAERVETNILDLLGGVINSHGEQKQSHRLSATEQVETIKTYINDNLRNRRLGPVMIAEAMGVSTRYIHKIFASQPNTVTRYIRTKRLEGCHRMLAHSDADSLSITEIALHWGFYDLSHMTRAFSEQYHMAPSVFRAKSRALTTH